MSEELTAGLRWIEGDEGGARAVRVKSLHTYLRSSSWWVLLTNHLGHRRSHVCMVRISFESYICMVGCIAPVSRTASVIPHGTIQDDGRIFSTALSKCTFPQPCTLTFPRAGRYTIIKYTTTNVVSPSTSPSPPKPQPVSSPPPPSYPLTQTSPPTPPPPPQTSAPRSSQTRSQPHGSS